MSDPETLDRRRALATRPTPHISSNRGNTAPSASAAQLTLSNDFSSLHTDWNRFLATGTGKPAYTMDDYAPYLMRFRRLREAMTSVGCDTLNIAFSIQVYELSTEIAIIAGHGPELLKCLVHLCLELYPRVAHSPDLTARHNEFASYYLLYYSCIIMAGNGSSDISDMNSLLQTLNAEQLQSKELVFALRIWTCIETCNYAVFFQSIASATPLQQSMLAHCCDSMRIRALKTMAKAYMEMPTDTVLKLLALSSSSQLVADLASASSVAKLSADGKKVSFRAPKT